MSMIFKLIIIMIIEMFVEYMASLCYCTILLWQPAVSVWDIYRHVLSNIDFFFRENLSNIDMK